MKQRRERILSSNLILEKSHTSACLEDTTSLNQSSLSLQQRRFNKLSNSGMSSIHLNKNQSIPGNLGTNRLKQAEARHSKLTATGSPGIQRLESLDCIDDLKQSKSFKISQMKNDPWFVTLLSVLI